MSATQELVGFLALLMAGLLPAMILTATILRAGAMSAKRVQDYGAALKKQLSFWAFLFAAAAAATAGVFLTKVYAQDPHLVIFAWKGVKVGGAEFEFGSLIIAGAGLGVVLQRAVPAYFGLMSLLELNLKIAQTEALSNDRSLSDALEQAAITSQPPPYQAGATTDSK